jgi:hypothetical protein
MTPHETAKLLALASVVDNRIIGPETVAEWHRIIGNIPFDLAREAMEAHFRGSTEYLKPAHITQIAHRIREKWDTDTTPALTRGNYAPKPHNFDAMSRAWNNPRKFQEEVRNYYNQVNGQDPF